MVLSNSQIQRAALVVTVAMLAGCGNSSPMSGDRSLDQARLDRIEKRLSDLEVEDIATRMKLRSMALLQPASKGFQAISTEAGSIAVSLQNVQPYGNGSRVELDVGNLTSATINDITADVSWGTVTDKGFADKELGKREKANLEGGFPAGNWRRYILDIPAVAPAKLGYIEIENVSFGHLQMPTVRQAE
jgi:hypothetical protein